MTIELNADVAEGSPYDDQILSLVQRANICLGAHAGSPELTKETLAKCRDQGIAVALHPGYPDLEGMGRRPAAASGLTSTEICESVLRQVHGLGGQATAIKPHGAFYNESATGGTMWDLLEILLSIFGLPLIGLPGTKHEEAAAEAGVPFIPEGFADRGYTEDGHLIPRDQPNAFVNFNTMASQVMHLLPRVKTLCVHGDGADPVGRLSLLKRQLEEMGVELKAWSQ